MKILSTVCILVSIMILSALSAFAKNDNCKANKADFKAITAVMKKNPDMGKVNKVYCPDIIENYARAVYDNNIDGGSAYLVKSDGKWKVLDFGTWIEEESLLELGIPKAIVDKLTN